TGDSKYLEKPTEKLYESTDLALTGRRLSRRIDRRVVTRLRQGARAVVSASGRGAHAREAGERGGEQHERGRLRNRYRGHHTQRIGEGAGARNDADAGRRNVADVDRIEEIGDREMVRARRRHA